jgi:hypothetical protein
MLRLPYISVICMSVLSFVVVLAGSLGYNARLG